MVYRRLMRLRRDVWSVELVQLNRCACLTAKELDELEAAHDTQHTTIVQQQQQPDACISSANVNGGREQVRGERRGGECRLCVPDTLVTEDKQDGSSTGSGEACPASDASSRLPLSEAVHDGSGSSTERSICARQGGAGDRHDEEREGTTTQGACFPRRALSAKHELTVLTEVALQLLEARDAFPTTLEHDEARRCERYGVVELSFLVYGF